MLIISENDNIIIKNNDASLILTRDSIIFSNINLTKENAMIIGNGTLYIDENGFLKIYKENVS